MNNGNLIRQEIVSPVGNFTQNYEYDGIGRLLKFSEGTKVEENVYDGYGNRAVYTEHARSKIRKDAPIHSAIGGFHLFNAKEETLVFTARKFREFGLQGFLGAHCTGIESVYRLRELAGLGRMSAAVGALGGGFDLETGLNPGAIAR